MTRIRILVLAVAIAVLGAACTSSPAPSTTTTAPAVPTTDDVTTSTAPSATTIPPDAIVGTVSPSLSDDVVERMRREVADLMGVAEQVRGLPFLDPPPVAILDRADFAARVRDLVAEALDPEALAADARFYTMMGMLGEGVDLEALLLDLYTEQVAGFYDGDTGELVVPASPDGFTALQRITVVHELVHALTDQQFSFYEEYRRRDEEGNGDDFSAMAALTEGDATYFQSVYLESLPPVEAIKAAGEALTLDSSKFLAAPRWIQSDLMFPYDQGLTFVQSLVADGGIARVDRAYEELPNTTEQILDPVKYFRREPPLPLDPVRLDLPGWEVHDEGSLGEWGFRLIIGESSPPGAATQAAAGWGNDSYQILVRGDDVAFAMHYVGDSIRDAEELTDALITHIKTKIDTGPGVESAGGLLYEGTVNVFIDRQDADIYFVASTERAAEEAMRAALGI